MGKPTSNNKKKNKPDDDGAIFIKMANDLKEEGNQLFQKQDYDGALVKYDKAISLLPKNHFDIAYLRTNLAACYMQMGTECYPDAIYECNSALQASPNYTKALLIRATCCDALEFFQIARKDVDAILALEPNNLTALELSKKINNSLAQQVKENTLDGSEVVVSPPPEALEPNNLNALELSQNINNSLVQGVSFDGKEIVSPSVALEPTNLNALELSQNITNSLVQGVSNLKALELSQNISNSLVEQVKGVRLDGKEVVSSPVVMQVNRGKSKKKNKKKKKNKTVDKVVEVEPIAEMPAAAAAEVKEDNSIMAVKLVFGEDIIRLTQIHSMSQLREMVQCRFPNLKAFLIKYRDKEGDLITITTSEELKWADDTSEPQGSLRLYINEVKPEHDPLFHDTNASNDRNLQVNDQEQENLCSIDEWIVEFAHLFKNHVGVDSDAYLDLHQLGMKLYSEAMEETVTGEEAMTLFDLASEKFQEMAALALFNRGNVFMSRARKTVFLAENDSEEAVLAQVKSSYEWAKGEYERARASYEEAMKIKPDFYEGLFALAYQQFEQAKLTWYFALGSKLDLGTWPSKEVLELFNNAEEKMERAMETWEEVEEQQFKPHKDKVIMEKMGLGKVPADEAAERAVNMRTQVHILWGRILYERSTVEFKLSLSTWEEGLMSAIEKFKFSGASPTDIAVIIKNHSSNDAAREGLGFKIDEIVQAWNEMYDAKRSMIGVPSFRLEALFRRRVPKLHQTLEHA